MAPKRKREAAANGDAAEKSNATKKVKAPPAKAAAPPKSTAFKLNGDAPVSIQLIAGSYDRVLHGITVTIKTTEVTSEPPAEAETTDKKKKSKKSKTTTTTTPTTTITQSASFADTFLFNAHNSAIRCLAISPPSAPAPKQTQKVLLATGSTDERINIYNLSAHPPSSRSASDPDAQLLSTLAPRPILENAKNRELGTLLHHTGNITRLCFPNRSKLLSSAEDSTIGVTRTRDWALLHNFKCPIPKVSGRPSGDTAGVGGTPQGVNDFAVHPSNKIMISVSKGERCMRLWNLETGKKSRVLNFERPMLNEAGEGKHSTGEARRIVWGTSSTKGGEDEFALAFDRDVVVFGMDCRPRCRIMGTIKTKVHEIKYIPLGSGSNNNNSDDDEDDGALLAVSTEDGRVLFFDTAEDSNVPAPEGKTLATARLVGQLGGKEAGVTGRVKDFVVLPVEDEEGKRSWFVATAGSDGLIRVWSLDSDELKTADGGDEQKRQVGKLLGTYGTQNRITCLEGFVMIPKPDGAEESEYEFDDSEEEDDDSDDE
ncbi:WD40-repeat-containing domain protein [Triangularia verruculosa]|uniref:WD40-repeat-containing domain protein n=1 Tax=Triangularia verruculosa TaxID=2587418 RepID=A0AAN6XH95_9PEZI|nr:WD40-repeat-containing domain protein [Triangularia verruculosa]